MFIANKVNGIKNDDKLIKKFIKPKIRKLFKSQKLAKLEKKLLKNKNLPNFKVKKNKSSFLTSKIKIVFNYLWLTFIETPIL